MLRDIDYPYWLSLGSWNYLVTACLLNGMHPDEMYYTPYSTGGVYEYHAPKDKQSAIRTAKILESWNIQHSTPSSWIEKCLREGMTIPSSLWEAFKVKYLRDCEYDEHAQSFYTAIKRKITAEKQLTSDNKQHDMANEILHDQLVTPSNQIQKNDRNEITDEEADQQYWNNPADRNPRLRELGIQYFIQLSKKNTEPLLTVIHKMIIEHEKGKSNIKIDSLKHIVKLKYIKNAAKKRMSENPEK